MKYLLAPFLWVAAFFRWVNAAFCALMDPEGRRAWAVILCGGCGIVMTAFAYAALYIVRDRPGYVFWLATEAFGIILVVISAITGLLVKRNIGGQVDLPGGGGGKVNIDQTGGEP